MYISKHTKKVKGKEYTSYCLRHSYRDKEGKVKHRHVARLRGCSNEEIEAMQYALKNKDKLCEVASLNEINLEKQTSIGASYLLKIISKQLGLTKALGNKKQGILALWQVVSRIIVNVNIKCTTNFNEKCTTTGKLKS